MNWALTFDSLLHLYHLKGVGIGFREPSYTIGEGESAVGICAVITDGEAAVPVEVTLMTGSDGNAQGVFYYSSWS